MLINFSAFSYFEVSFGERSVRFTKRHFCGIIRLAIKKGEQMIEEFGGSLNFVAVLIPCLMGLFYGYRCLLATDAFIGQ